MKNESSETKKTHLEKRDKITGSVIEWERICCQLISTWFIYSELHFVTLSPFLSLSLPLFRSRKGEEEERMWNERNQQESINDRSVQLSFPSSTLCPNVVSCQTNNRYFCPIFFESFFRQNLTSFSSSSGR